MIKFQIMYPIKKEHLNILMPSLIFVFSFFIRLALISKGHYHVDCLNLIIQVEKTLSTSYLGYLNGPGYPLVVIFGTFFTMLCRFFSVTDPVFAVNFMSVVISSLSIIAFYFVAKKFFGLQAAIYSSILFSISPAYLGVSVYGIVQPICILFLMLGIFFIEKYYSRQLKDAAKYSQKANSSSLYIAALFLGLMGAARIQELVLMMPAVTLLFFFGVKEQKFSINKKQIKDYFVFCIVIATVAISFHLIYLMQPDAQIYKEQMSAFWNVNVTHNVISLVSSRLLLCINYFIQTFSPIGFIASIIGLFLIFKDNKKIFIFLVCWLVVPLEFYGNLNSTVTARYIIISFPPLLIAQGYLFAKLIDKGIKVRLFAFSMYLLTIYILLQTIVPVLLIRHRHAILPDFAKWLGQVIEPDALVITADEGSAFEYFGGVMTMPRPAAIFYTEQKDLENFKNKLDAILETGTPVYITSAGLYAYNRDDHFRKFFNKHYTGHLIGQKLIEDWHKGAMTLQTSMCDLWRVSRRSL